ncbi:MAG TPA: D-alanyl-D-alanine carboxypeptidase family protein [Chthonomonadaceae bacterium]|nr:D-alanyl-D-alanine carboxypeptidase family protein [Chthonomonadaceae bacterium]
MTAANTPVLRGRRPANLPDIHAYGAILIDAASGQVLYENNADKELPMASTTKIMTALLFCEHVRDTDIITASPTACAVSDSSIHLLPGERMSGNDMLHAILMRSANDGCVAAAEHIAGSEAAFVDMMNARAAELGATHTHFANSNGLPDPDHYTSARDLALIARAAMQEPRIRAIVRTTYYTIHRSMNWRDVHLKNHSHFLGHFPGADGIKTGWTHAAGHCYVGSATWNGWELISVVLHSPDYVHETEALMKYGFTSFRQHVIARAQEPLGTCPVRGGLQSSVPVTVKTPLEVVLPKDEEPSIEREVHLDPVSAPVYAGATVGTVEAVEEERGQGVGQAMGKVVGSVPVVAAESDLRDTNIFSTTSGGPWGRMVFATTIMGMGLVSLRYGTRSRRFAAFAKSARRRRRRLAQSLRGSHRLR